jgi:hypothetical protein
MCTAGHGSLLHGVDRIGQIRPRGAEQVQIIRLAMA